MKLTLASLLLASSLAFVAPRDAKAMADSDGYVAGHLRLLRRQRSRTV